MPKKILIRTPPESYPKFVFHCRALKLPAMIAEYKFHPERRWRFDYCFVDQKIAVEFEGGIWVDPSRSAKEY